MDRPLKIVVSMAWQCFYVWKAIFTELITWSLAYLALFVTLHYWCNDLQRNNFEEFRHQLEQHLKEYPIVFMLGFFVNVIFNRWCTIFQYIGFVDNLALATSTAIRGVDPETRLVKRNIVRYAVLAQALVFRDISIQCRERFPTIDSLVDAGLMTPTEHEIYESKSLSESKFWMPILWALNLISQAREQGKVQADVVMWQAQEKIREFRNNLQKLACYDYVPVPLAYPQIIYICVRAYFCLLLITSQIIKNPLKYSLFYVPWCAIIKFILMAGWVKVSETLINPFGLDDDDYDCNYIIDRNLMTGLAIVDAMRMPPSNELDAFWNLTSPKPLDTMSLQSKPIKEKAPYHGSVADLDLSRTTNDSHYQPSRTRVRPTMQRMASTQSSKSQTCIPPTGVFFDGISHRYNSPSLNRLHSFNDYSFTAHRLDNLSELGEEDSRRESMVAQTNESTANPSLKVHTPNTQISILSLDTLGADSSVGEQEKIEHEKCA